MEPVTTIRGASPIILGQPHSGTFVPPKIERKLNPLGKELRDTDWHVPQLYDGLLEGATIVRANFSRYVIDANRDPSGASLYPGQNTTGLIPTTSFDGDPIWEVEPDAAEIGRRLDSFHGPYHAAMQAEIERVKAVHGFAVLYDCHSIRSQIPHLFDDRLPDFNIGDNGGQSCNAAITRVVAECCETASTYTTIINGRFKGGWTTRHYGRPQDGLHAIQMELAQRNYLASETPPFAYAPEKAEALRDVLRAALNAISDIAKTRSLGEKL
ncbi:N-formylglutamate deformylase [Pontixanthobacter aestiaquae]|uniref:N-formylglutamate deformylase n=1 Tax=Pontixanthobacter aestiaquae TaxID=1509367 RepID=A0A844Z500_9SPHN|nr:N-formylglutamate deformylase [Pontixanthobacter aestiaquae]MDN3646593.1 N-formylglutamate deformylase [Pontixanthobacter aestiaquae]MXO82422.1 N-formylglutamate deformylase [Pontixanthobacter aestiaquae]